MANMEMPPVEELVARFKKLYTGIVADAMDKLGMRDRLLPQYLRPLKPDMVIAGPAFTGCGEEVTDINCNDNDIRFSMLESIKPYDIPVWQTNMTDGCAHWGGIMTRSTRQAGGCGAIIDGGCRDCNDILEQGCPVFVGFLHCGRALGRWKITSYQQPIQIGHVTIEPGDFMMADIDGVLAVPKAHIMEVLTKAEEMAAREDNMSKDMAEGLGVRGAYAKYGTI